MANSRPFDKRKAAPKGKVWFNPWLSARGELAALVQHIAADIERKRITAVYPQHRLSFDATINAMVCNLQRSVTLANSGRIAIPVSNQAGEKGMQRYECSDVPVKLLRGVVETAHKAGWLSFIKGHRGKTSTIKPTAQFRRALLSGAETPDCVHEREGQELIVVKNDDDPVPYDDTAQTHGMRAEIQAINSFLAAADIDFVIDTNGTVNTDDRTLRRHFSLFDGQAPRFDQGGRLFGNAFWNDLAREWRRPGLRINGEMIAEVDLNAAYTRFAMALCHVQLDDSDPYDLGDDVAAHRSGIKMAVNALFFSDGMLKRWPNDVAAELPKGMNFAKLTKRVLHHFPQLEQFFGTRMGFAFMFTESQITVQTMLRLIDMGMTALPLHDAMLVARSDADTVKSVLEAVALDVTGYRIPAGIKLHKM